MKLNGTGLSDGADNSSRPFQSFSKSATCVEIWRFDRFPKKSKVTPAVDLSKRRAEDASSEVEIFDGSQFLRRDDNSQIDGAERVDLVANPATD